MVQLVARRALLGAAVALPLGACGGKDLSRQMSSLFGSTSPKLLSRCDRMVRWVYNSGEERMMAPDALSVMGITNEAATSRCGCSANMVPTAATSSP